MRAHRRAGESAAASGDAKTSSTMLLAALEAARCAPPNASEGTWNAVPWVKRGILLGFRVGRLARHVTSGRDDAGAPLLRQAHVSATAMLTLADGVRVVPGGSSIRRGAYSRPASSACRRCTSTSARYVGTRNDGRLARARRLVRADRRARAPERGGADRRRARAGERVRRSLIEDDVIVGGNCGVYEGTVVRARAVLGAGVVLTRGTPVFDLVRETGLSRRRADSRSRFPQALSWCLARAASRRMGRRAGTLAADAGDREVPRREDRPRDGARRLAAMTARRVRVSACPATSRSRIARSSRRARDGSSRDIGNTSSRRTCSRLRGVLRSLGVPIPALVVDFLRSEGTARLRVSRVRRSIAATAERPSG